MVEVRNCIDPAYAGSFVSTPTYEPVDAVDVGCATYTLKSRAVTVFVFETRTPRLIPAPFEYTFIVDPFSELNEKLPGPSEPVPLHSTPITFDVPRWLQLNYQLTQVMFAILRLLSWFL